MLEGLNEEQKEAVSCIDGPLLIMAGAGSGKTRVLTHRISYMLSMGINPYNVLAITFTNKAALEMKERVITLVGDKANCMQISTFHSFGLRILRDNYEVLGYDKNFVILDSEDSLSIIKKIIKNMNLDSNIYNPKAIRSIISSNKNELVMPDDYLKFAISDYEKDVLEIYKKYQSILQKNNSVDFDDLLVLPVQLFSNNEDILVKYQERYKYILIDEYQDTNQVQYILTKLIGSKYRNVCVCGDVDQAIYSFRGANYKNILNFENDFKDAKVIKLLKNYRSVKMVLDAANNVIVNNKARCEKELISTLDVGDKITYFRGASSKDEVGFVSKEIKRLNSVGVNLDDIVVLYRTNAQSRTFEEEFLASSIPYRMVGSIQFYSRREIKDLIAYLRIIYNDRDDESLLRVINVPKRGIGDKTISNLVSIANTTSKSVYEVIECGKEKAFKEMIEEFKRISKELSLTELIDKVLEVSGMKDELVNEKTLEADIRLENLEEFKSITKSFEEKNGNVSLDDFLYEVSLVSDVSNYKDDVNQVTLMTIHSVKGLEFDYVFLVGMEEGLFPHINSIMNNTDVEEERRLCYVAITRAKLKLYITNARSRVLYGRDQVNQPSRFISEIGDDLIDRVNTEKKKNDVIFDKKAFMKSDEEASYQIGDYLYHDVFGAGKVVSISGSLISIAFKNPYGVKMLLKNHKSLRRI